MKIANFGKLIIKIANFGKLIMKIANFGKLIIKITNFEKLIIKIAKLRVSKATVRQIDYSIIIVLLRICLNYRKFKLLEIMAFYDKL